MTNLTALETQMLVALSFNDFFQVNGGAEIWSSELESMSNEHLLPAAAQRGAILASLQKKGLVKVSMSGTRDAVIRIPQETAAMMVDLRGKA